MAMPTSVSDTMQLATEKKCTKPTELETLMFDMRTDLECPCCLDLFVEPKQLRCGHTFCEECLSATAFGASEGVAFECSVCRQRHQGPMESIGTNYVIKEQVERLVKLEKLLEQEQIEMREIRTDAELQRQKADLYKRQANSLTAILRRHIDLGGTLRTKKLRVEQNSDVENSRDALSFLKKGIGGKRRNNSTIQGEEHCGSDGTLSGFSVDAPIVLYHLYISCHWDIRKAHHVEIKFHVLDRIAGVQRQKLVSSSMVIRPAHPNRLMLNPPIKIVPNLFYTLSFCIEGESKPQLLRSGYAFRYKACFGVPNVHWSSKELMPNGETVCDR